MTEEALSVHHLTVYYHKNPVVWDVSLNIPGNKLIGILGPNGAGKSTFVKALLGIIQPSSGKVSFFSKPLKEFKKEIAYIPQRSSIDWDFPITAFEVVLMGAYQKLGWFKRPSKVDRQRAMHYLQKLEMDEYADRQIGELSGGQQQRLFIARALMQEAKMYFFDEPFIGIDHTTENFLLHLFKELVAEGKTIFVIHHDLTQVKEYFNWGIFLNNRLIDAGPMEKIFTMTNLRETFGNKEEILEKALILSEAKQRGYE